MHQHVHNIFTVNIITGACFYWLTRVPCGDNLSPRSTNKTSLGKPDKRYLPRSGQRQSNKANRKTNQLIASPLPPISDFNCQQFQRCQFWFPPIFWLCGHAISASADPRPRTECKLITLPSINKTDEEWLKIDWMIWPSFCRIKRGRRKTTTPTLHRPRTFCLPEVYWLYLHFRGFFPCPRPGIELVLEYSSLGNPKPA